VAKYSAGFSNSQRRRKGKSRRCRACVDLGITSSSPSFPPTPSRSPLPQPSASVPLSSLSPVLSASPPTPPLPPLPPSHTSSHSPHARPLTQSH
jgi:hypothetical protein